jgi:hypothetical protein
MKGATGFDGFVGESGDFGDRVACLHSLTLVDSGMA